MTESLPEGTLVIPAGKEHRSFILSTWVRSSWEDVKRTEPSLSYGVFIANEPKIAEKAFAKGYCYVLVSDEDHRVIISWACVETPVSGNPVVHWAYVPPEFRGERITTAVLKSVLGLDYGLLETSRDASCELAKRFIYNPYKRIQP